MKLAGVKRYKPSPLWMFSCKVMRRRRGTALKCQRSGLDRAGLSDLYFNFDGEFPPGEPTFATWVMLCGLSGTYLFWLHSVWLPALGFSDS